jgi:hypothetical protein
VPNQLPPHLKIQRAKVIVDNEGEKFLTTCESCDKEMYLPEGETICKECKSGRKKTQNKKAQKRGVVPLAAITALSTNGVSRCIEDDSCEQNRKPDYRTGNYEDKFGFPLAVDCPSIPPLERLHTLQCLFRSFESSRTESTEIKTPKYWCYQRSDSPSICFDWRERFAANAQNAS